MGGLFVRLRLFLRGDVVPRCRDSVAYLARRSMRRGCRAKRVRLSIRARRAAVTVERADDAGLSRDAAVVGEKQRQVAQRSLIASFFFFFQAEDGIRDLTVTGVQTCALPI